ncbi:MAG: transketolase-like TK C-terminal-containing protein, partial [Rhodospirillaceae bacterium]
PFEVPEDILGAWRKAGARGADARAAWVKRLAAAPGQAEFKRLMAGELPAGWEKVVEDFKQAASASSAVATRQSSQSVLEALTAAIPEMIGGSADLTGSNNTKTAKTAPISAKDFSGRYIYYGVREHGMAAAMNGLALHGGVVPYGGTFLVFTDYCRPAIRLSALMGLRVIYVMTHDSIGLGEDGPTHQPVEHLSTLRAIPNLLVMRPCDTVETAECWAIALQEKQRPTVLALTRQAVPILRTTHTPENLSAKGGYVLAEAEGPRQATLFATGSEVSLAMDARQKLKGDGIAAAVVSMPCWELFDTQSEDYRRKVLGDGVRVAIEAASAFGWERYLGANGVMIGMQGFGASAPAPALYKHFGITSDAMVAAVKSRLKA